MNTLFEIRRNNLNQLVLDKFNGNKSALARAADVHHNHINLLLSANEVHRRNMGEDLARRVEKALGLPQYWLDKDHSNDDDSVSTIHSMPLDNGLKRVLKTSSVTSLALSTTWIRAQMPEASGPDNLFLAAVATDEMAPDLLPKDIVMIDAAVKAYTVDGVYLLTAGNGDAYLRRIRKQLAGNFVVSAGEQSETMGDLHGLSVLGRVVQKIQMCRV
jgi:plasmid maintenance system antidote protein VapI